MFTRRKTHGFTALLWKTPRRRGRGAEPAAGAAYARPGARHDHHAAETLARAALAPRQGLFGDEMELCRRDARRRWLNDEPADDRVIVEIRPCAFNFL